MKTKLILVATALVATALFLCAQATAFAKDRAGNYQTSTGKSGTYQQNTTRQPGQTNKSLNWQNQNGQTGSRVTQKKWNAENKTASSLTAYDLPSGKSVIVDRSVSFNKGTGVSIENTATTGSGKTISTQSNFQKTDNGITGSGSYSLGSGKTGTYETSSKIVDGKLVSEQSLTNSSGKTIEHTAQTGLSNGTLTRYDYVTGPGGKTATAGSTAYISDGGQINMNQTLISPRGVTYGRSSQTDFSPGGVSQDVTLYGPDGRVVGQYQRNLDNGK